jgi:AraC-like DNA-binding protein
LPEVALLLQNCVTATSCESVRAPLSRELPENSGLVINVMASALDYFDYSSFTRACQRWHGTSWSHWREQAGQATDGRCLAGSES